MIFLKENMQKVKEYYEPIHFENSINDILLKNEPENIICLSDSYLYYGKIFIKCIYIRKILISKFKKLIDDIIHHSLYNLTESILDIKDKSTIPPYKVYKVTPWIGSWILLLLKKQSLWLTKWIGKWCPKLVV